MIDLTNLDNDELYVAAFERPGGLDELLASIKAGPSSPEIYETLYDVYTSAVRRYISERATPEELADLSDHLMRVRGVITRRLSTRNKSGSIADRLGAFEDLVDDALESVRRAIPNAVLQRTHTREILRYLADQRGSAKRSELREHFGLGEANTSRMIKLLADTRFIDRFSEGKEVLIRLTPAGHAAADKIKPELPLPSVPFIIAGPIYGDRHDKIIVKTPVTTIWDMLQFPYARELDLPNQLGLDIKIEPIFDRYYVRDVLGISQRIFAREANIAKALNGVPEIWAHVAPYKHFNANPLLDIRGKTLDVCVMSKYDGFPIVAMSKRKTATDWSNMDSMRRAAEFKSLLLSCRRVTIRYLKGDEAVHVYLKAMLQTLGFEAHPSAHVAAVGIERDKNYVSYSEKKSAN